MISDSQYEVTPTALPAGAGAIAGAIAALLVFGLASLGHATSSAAGEYVAGLARQLGRSDLIVGLALHGAAGAVLGALYASSQRAAPPAGLMAAGLFYGIAVWVILTVFVVGWIDSDLRAAMRNWTGLASSMAFGASLSSVAWLWQRAHQRAIVVPRD